MTNKTCLALHCTSSAKDNEDLKFHHFPIDAKRRRIWIEACKITDLIDEGWEFFRSKYLCSLHFEKCMYSNKKLQRAAYPSLHLSNPLLYNCSTQTWDSIQFFRSTLDTHEISDAPDLKKIEIRSYHTQTEELMLGADHNKEVKIESDSTCTDTEKHMQIDEPTPEIKEYETSHKTMTKEKSQSVVNKNENKDETEDVMTSGMSVAEFIQNAGLKKETGKVQRKENIPQTLIEKSIEYVGFEKANKEREGIIMKTVETQIENFEQSNAHLQEMKVTNDSPLRSCTCLVNREIQTDEVVVYIVPKTPYYFQQCIRCGKRQKVINDGRPQPKVSLTLECCSQSKDSLTLEEFLKGCEKFLSPMFCSTVKHHIQLEQLLREIEKTQNQELPEIKSKRKRRR